VEGKTAALKGSFFPTPPPADLKDLHDHQHANLLWAPDIKTWEVEEAVEGHPLLIKFNSFLSHKPDPQWTVGTCR